ncbi:acyltransferase, WS/DGAT/MGAT [Pseudomonas sp. GM78]|uniref:wax ester/triacylglycerol synthase family O-acyltransferase n=1 Tax=Pseudomonas sp. GM78 TaxID=1144337 RepID=UPI00026FC23E|nr:wax ester/triacylglycerol synthase family O-acyltransferase [Pseudomonas sp. GM78]EJN35066.1 acyltransferase, WS/DGAT/MGAT [Pseudomonas sp. GM78]
MNKLSGQDALFLHVDRPHASSHGTMIYIYDQTTLNGQRLGFREIVHHIESRLDPMYVQRRKIVQVPFGLGYPYWVEDDLFDIDFHVRHFALPKPGDWRQFCILLSRIHARSVDLSRSPWEMYVIEGLDNIEGIPKGSFAIITKTHHAAMDGTAAAEFTWAMHDLAGAPGKPGAITPKPQPAHPPCHSRRITDTLTRMVIDNISASARMAAPLRRVLPKLATFGLRRLAQSLRSSDGGVPRTRFNANVSAKRVWDSVTLDLATVKQIKGLVPGATINDAVLAMIGGAMRRYLQAKDELPEKSLVSMAPVNTRQEGAERTTNTISILRFPLGTHIDDPLERLQAVQLATAECKAIQSAIGAHELTNLQKFTPPATLGLAGRLATLTGGGGKGPVLLHNCMVTNVPGPNEPLYLLGAKLVHWGGMGPLADGMSLIWNPTSYCGKMFISLTSSPNIVPDPDFLARCLLDSYEEMRDVAHQICQPVTTAPVPGKRRKPRMDKARQARMPVTRAASTGVIETPLRALVTVVDNAG